MTEARRSKGDGDVYYDESKGLWYGAVVIDGRRVKTRGAKTAKEARTRLIELRRRSGVLDLTVDDMTVGGWAQHWLDTANMERSRNTADKARSDVTKHIIGDDVLASIPLRELRTRHVDDWLRGKVAQGYAASTLTKTLGNLKLILKLAVRHERVERNVAEPVTVPRHSPHIAPKMNKHALTTDELSRWVPACRKDQHHTWGTVFLTALALYCRPSEVLGLRWADVDFERSRIRVAGAIKRDGNGKPLHFGDTKNRKRRPYVAVDPFVLDMLDDHRLLVDSFKHNGKQPHPRWADLVFLNPDTAQPWHLGVMGDHLERICADANVTRITPHEIRHTAVTLSLSTDWERWRDLAYVAGFTERVMFDVYGHLIHDEAPIRPALGSFA